MVLGQLDIHTQKTRIGSLPYRTKFYFKCVTYLNVDQKTINLWRKRRGISLWLWVRQSLLRYTTMSNKTKKRKSIGHGSNKNLKSLSLPSLCVISRFLSSISLILSSIWSILFPKLKGSFLISFTELVISRISIWLFFSFSLFGTHFCSLILFLSSLNCLCAFSYNLRFF